MIMYKTLRIEKKMQTESVSAVCLCFFSVKRLGPGSSGKSCLPALKAGTTGKWRGPSALEITKDL